MGSNNIELTDRIRVTEKEKKKEKGMCGVGIMRSN